MSIKVEPITTITVGEQQIPVTDFTENIQEMIALYNDWRDRSLNLKSEFTMSQAAITEITGQLKNAVAAWVEAKNKPETTLDLNQVVSDPDPVNT